MGRTGKDVAVRGARALTRVWGAKGRQQKMALGK